MIADALLMFSDVQVLSATGNSTNILDFAGQRNLGVGEGMTVVVCADVPLAGTSPTLSVALQFDDNSGFASPTTVATSQSVTSLPAGGKIYLALPPMNNGERYARLAFTLGGTTPTVTVTAFLQPSSMIQNDGVYADAITIS